MVMNFSSSHRVQSLLAICLVSAGVCAARPVQAGPTLETIQNTAIGAQATFNNSWAQTFEAKGAMSIVGGSYLLPFEQVTNTIVPLPNSGLASLTATVSSMTVDGGTVEGRSFVNPEGQVNGTAINANNVVLNPSNTNGLPALQITPGTTDASVIGASIIGTNIGTASLQVTGALNNSVINTLTAF